jgi:hypothetical protein
MADVKRSRIISLAAVTALALGAVAPAKVLPAGMFDMMNPGKWFGDDDDYYGRYGRYGYGPYGYGGGPYGWGGGPYGWGGPHGGWGGPYGWGGGPYGWGGYPGYGAGNTIVVTPKGSDEKSAPRLPE